MNLSFSKFAPITVALTTPGLSKVKPIKLEALVKASDLIIYVQPTEQTFRPAAKELIFRRERGPASRMIHVNPGSFVRIVPVVKKPEELEVTFDGVRQVGILFLKLRGGGHAGAPPIEEFFREIGWIPLTKGQAPCTKRMVADERSYKITGYAWEVDDDILFPASANPNSHPAITSWELTKVIREAAQKLAKSRPNAR
jgi:hypothetical protein